MLKNQIKIFIFSALLFAISFFSSGCSYVIQSEFLLENNAKTEEYTLYNHLYLKDICDCAIASYTWDDPNKLQPDFLVEFFSKKTQLYRLSTDSDPIIVPENIVEEYVQLFFNVKKESLKKSDFYLPEQHSYSVPIISPAPGNICIDKVVSEGNILSISYSFYRPNESSAFRHGTVQIQLPSNPSEAHRYLSCQVENME